MFVLNRVTIRIQKCYAEINNLCKKVHCVLQFVHLSSYERGQIQAYLSQHKSYRYIAKQLNRSISTISREVKKGTVKQLKQINGYTRETFCYYADTGQLFYEQNRKRSVSKSIYQFYQPFFKELEIALKAKQRIHSVESFVESYPKKNQVRIPCFKTIYRYIQQGKLSVKPIDLPRMVRFKSRKLRSVSKKKKTRYGRSIEERPSKVNRREEFGHWEIDIVIGKQGKKNPFY